MLIPLNRAALKSCLEEGLSDPMSGVPLADGWAVRIDGSVDPSRAVEMVVEALDLAERREQNAEAAQGVLSDRG
jgi:hypothetical protein